MYRDRNLLDMAWGEECLLLVPGVCRNDSTSTVACHSNLGEHGKGRGLKAHDFMSVQGCGACHDWLDKGPAPYEEKRAAFDAAHERQIEHWRAVAAELTRRPRNVMSARKALDAWAKYREVEDAKRD